MSSLGLMYFKNTIRDISAECIVLFSRDAKSTGTLAAYTTKNTTGAVPPRKMLFKLKCSQTHAGRE